MKVGSPLDDQLVTAKRVGRQERVLDGVQLELLLHGALSRRGVLFLELVHEVDQSIALAGQDLMDGRANTKGRALDFAHLRRRHVHPYENVVHLPLPPATARALSRAARLPSRKSFAALRTPP